MRRNLFVNCLSFFVQVLKKKTFLSPLNLVWKFLIVRWIYFGVLVALKVGFPGDEMSMAARVGVIPHSLWSDCSLQALSSFPSFLCVAFMSRCVLPVCKTNHSSLHSDC